VGEGIPALPDGAGRHFAALNLHKAFSSESVPRSIDAQGSLAKAWTDLAQAGVKRIQSSDIEV
jgi:hypothetical protein